MNFNSAKDIEELSDNIIDKIKAIKDKRDEYVKDINSRIKDLEDTINAKNEHSQVWIDMQVAIKTKKIQDKVDGINKFISNKLSQLEDWYDTQMNKIVTSVIVTTFAKIGQKIKGEDASNFSDLVPYPPFKSFVDADTLKIKLDTELIKEKAQLGVVSLPRI